MPDHAFELSFTAACEQAIVQQWLALQAADIPSQADHRSMTNAPHLTLVAAAPIDPQVIGPAVSLIGPLLPTEVRLRGLILLGSGPRITIAHLVEPTAELAEATARLRALVPGLRHPVWMPHLTLARRVPRRLLSAALEVVHASPAPRCWWPIACAGGIRTPRWSRTSPSASPRRRLARRRIAPGEGGGQGQALSNQGRCRS